MSDVEFNPNQNKYKGYQYEDNLKSPKIIKTLLKTGLVKNEKQANYVLMGVAVVAILFTIILLTSTFGDNTPKNVPSTNSEGEENY